MNVLSRLQLASRRDVLLYVVATIVVLVICAAWAVLVVPIFNDQVLNKYLITIVFLVISIAMGFVGGIPRLRGSRRSLGAFMVRAGMAMQIFGTAISLVGLFYATDPSRSVPVAFAAFTLVFLGIFVAGFGGNMLAPKSA